MLRTHLSVRFSAMSQICLLGILNHLAERNRHYPLYGMAEISVKEVTLNKFYRPSGQIRVAGSSHSFPTNKYITIIITILIVRNNFVVLC